MKYSYLPLLLVLFLQFLACKNTNKEPSVNRIISISADNNKSLIELKLSDLAESFRLIPLETNNECLLGENTTYYVYKSFIIAYSQNGVYKFSADGKFIKKLFGLGRGPDEFLNLMICIFLVDEKKDILYINDQVRRGVYLRYDLKSEHFLDPVKQCFPAFGSFEIDKDSLIIASNYFSNSDYAVYFQNFNGDFVSGINHSKKFISNQKEISQKGRLIKADSIYYYYFRYDDTLYRIKESKFVPYLELNFNVPRENPPKETIKKGDRFINFQGAPSFLIIHIDIIEDAKLYYGGVGGEKGYYLLFNNFTGKASRINSYTDNFIGETKDDLRLSKVDIYNPFFLTLLPNSKIVTAYYPNQIKNAIEKSIDNKDFQDSLNKQLIKINETLKESDNPVLLVGNLKIRL